MHLASSQKVRRERVERGIYRRVGSDGRPRYEITFTDSEDRQRWKTVEGGLKDARAARGDVLHRIQRGERVAPSKTTFDEYAAEWLANQAHLRPRSLKAYETALRLHILPRLGRRKLSSINVDDVARLLAELRAEGLSGWSVRTILTPLSRLLASAVRAGLIPQNPCKQLDRGERPSVGKREMHVLDREEIGKLLASSLARFRPLLATAIFTGLRQGELLGLRWQDIDFTGQVVRVRLQLGRDGKLAEPKTPQAKRDVLLPAFLLKELRSLKLSSRFSTSEDFVFCSALGTPLHYRAASRGLEKAVERAGIEGRVRFHDLRHCCASLLISAGLDVLFCSRALGHANPSMTLDTYAHLFDQHLHADRARDVLEKSFGGILA